MKPILTILFLYLFSFALFAQTPTWTEHIAPIIYENCSPCHHAGAIAPFELMSYEDVMFHANDIHHVIEERSMPPWPADPEYRHFVGEAYLAQSDIDAIHQWIENGFPYGDEVFETAPPQFPPAGSLLETIDFTVSIEPYTLQTDTDEYRWFVIENPFEETVYISQIEVFPGLTSVVHHADLFLDGTGSSLAFDLQDPLSGFNGSTGFPQRDQYINAWQPGANIIQYPENWGFAIPPGADFVVEIHYGPGGIGLTDTTKMNLQFISDPVNVRPVKAAWLMLDSWPVLVDGPLVIPANEVVIFHQETAPLQNDLSLIAICPHMHLLGKSYKVWFESPEGEVVPLIDIPHWDFHWQKYYAFQEIQPIPAGSVLKSEGVYDNTLDNHDNPNDPPVTVSSGPYTEDEMFLCYFIYANYEAGDEQIVMDSTLLATTVKPVENTTKNRWTVFPNPVTHQLYWEGEIHQSDQLVFSIRDISGQLVSLDLRRDPRNFAQQIFDVRALESGIYFLEWFDSEEKKIVKFVKM